MDPYIRRLNALRTQTEKGISHLILWLFPLLCVPARNLIQICRQCCMCVTDKNVQIASFSDLNGEGKEEYQTEYEIMEKNVVGISNLHTTDLGICLCVFGFCWFKKNVYMPLRSPASIYMTKKAFIWYLSDVNLRFNEKCLLLFKEFGFFCVRLF